jgi:hypothetical protein
MTNKKEMVDAICKVAWNASSSELMRRPLKDIQGMYQTASKILAVKKEVA